jgi:hypothetical protein
MDYRLIKQILDMERTTSDEKVSLISSIVEQYENLDMFTNKMASDEGRKPTLEDKYQAMLKFAEDKGISLSENVENVDHVIKKGISYIMDSQLKNGGWGRTKKKQFPIILHAQIQNELSQPLATAWDTAMAIFTLINYYKFFSKEPDVDPTIERGLEWLLNNQEANGAWRDVDKNFLESPYNIIQTTMATCALIYMCQYFNDQSVMNTIPTILKFLMASHDKKSGGWPTWPGQSPDVKATSLVSMCCTLLKEIKFADLGIRWLLKNQTPEGDWAYTRTPAYFLYGEYYGIEALHTFRSVFQAEIKKEPEYDRKIRTSIRKALNWYCNSNKLVRYQKKLKWIWRDGDEIADVENTAAAICVLLDCAEDDFSFVIQKGVEWLMEQMDFETYWGVDTSIVLYCLIKYSKPESRRYRVFYTT